LRCRFSQHRHRGRLKLGRNSAFTLTEVDSVSTNTLASAANAIVSLTSPGKTSTTVKIKPLYVNGAAKTMTLTLTDAAGTTQTVNADATVTGPPAANMVFWFKADAGVTYDGSNNVSAWADQSGNVRDATSSGGNQPLYVASGQNSLPIISMCSPAQSGEMVFH
jgi:hypothetical protein